ncbi:hypothetical protein [Candidatus Symbiothrix dinenymphae]|uniref:hypothetical protein n=1 Tax=Candidatus Symbiothrix dinenymphae TaxID=467085 RepID=UPI0006BEE926|nr:hypothetical protein [Candidatus Symbiothrix dinenymphae]GAP71928.1 hypothetical protein SAMD00024442_20_14 [Candidatus Symbiothrix dinenymphae]
MTDVLGVIYSLLCPLFDYNLGDYLWGYDCDAQAYINVNLFNQIGLIAIGVSLVFVLVYYYALQRFKSWWTWLIMLFATGSINLLIGYGWTVSSINSGLIGDCLMYVKDEEGQVVSQLIQSSNCWAFGCANAIIAAVFLILFTLCFRWWSPTQWEETEE